MSVGIGANAFKAVLAQALNAGGSETTIYLDTITTLTGEDLSTADFAVFGKGTLTVDPLNSGSMEFASFTAVDTTNIALTGLIRGLSAFDSTSSTSRAFYHPVGTTVIIAFGVHDLQNFKTYVDGVIAGTVGSASASVYGVTKLSTAPVLASAPIAVGDNDTRVPTTSQAAALPSTTTPGASNLYITQKDFQKGAEIYAADSVGTDSYAITLSPIPAAYVTGMTFRFKTGVANTGAATLNVNGLGAKTIKKNLNSDLSTGDILLGQLVEVIYDGTNFQLLSPVSQTLVYATGLSTNQNLSLTTALVIPHGLGSTPKRVQLSVSFTTGVTVSHSMSNYANSTQISNSFGGSGTSWQALNSFSIFGDASNYLTGTITLDATNITLNWTKAGSPSGTFAVCWEAWL